MKRTKKAGLVVKSSVKMGGTDLNHSTAGLMVKSRIRAGGTNLNHSSSLLAI